VRKFDPILGIIGLLTGATLVAGCSAEHAAQVKPGGATAPAAPAFTLDPAVEHVHGAVVVNGSLLLGTHGGLVEVDLATGSTKQRSTARHDFMGLAAGGSTLVASGHPGPDTDLPDPLGLLRSDDGGVSWQSVSLAGEVDFHGLAVDGARIAGIGTEQGVLLSEDAGKSWMEANVMDATSLAWFQGGLWIATEEGLRVWRDGATSDAPSTAQAPVVLAAADDGSALWAVRPDGTVWRTGDGTAWDQRGTVSALEALAGTADAAYAITAESVTVIRGR
jgi:hypothetical protein